MPVMSTRFVMAALLGVSFIGAAARLSYDVTSGWRSAAPVSSVRCAEHTGPLQNNRISEAGSSLPLETQEFILHRLPDHPGNCILDSWRVHAMNAADFRDVLIKYAEANARGVPSDPLLEVVLLHWTGAASADPRSRGLLFDGRKLTAMEAYHGAPWTDASLPAPHIWARAVYLFQDLVGRPRTVMSTAQARYLETSWEADVSRVRTIVFPQKVNTPSVAAKAGAVDGFEVIYNAPMGRTDLVVRDPDVFIQSLSQRLAENPDPCAFFGTYYYPYIEGLKNPSRLATQGERAATLARLTSAAIAATAPQLQAVIDGNCPLPPRR